ncbi:MAG: ribbon-helix-helix protein, CopG family [Thermococci archaeon]|nr:ribbon-helix-helix protein, CopG family [Thermococci archaeon]
MANTVKISARLPSKIVEEIDRAVQMGIFSNRSDFLKEAARYYLRELSKERFIEEAEEEKWVLRVVQPTLAEDWDSPEDDYWNDY